MRRLDARPGDGHAGTVSTLPAFRETGAGAPLVLINGYAAGAADWDPTFLSALAAHSRVICPDNRGIGASPPIAGTITPAAMADDVVALMDDLDLATADVAGWSMGGFVAQELAARAPDRVRRLVLLSTDAGGPDAVSASPQTWAQLTDHTGSPREQARRLIGLLFPPEPAAMIDRDFGDIVAAARAGLDPHTLAAQEAAIAEWHAEPAHGRLARIRVPALVAAGAQDVVIPAANVALLAAALPGSRQELFPGCGHGFMAQEPAALAGLINDWLGR